MAGKKESCYFRVAYSLRPMSLTCKLESRTARGPAGPCAEKYMMLRAGLPKCPIGMYRANLAVEFDWLGCSVSGGAIAMSRRLETTIQEKMQ